MYGFFVFNLGKNMPIIPINLEEIIKNLFVLFNNPMYLYRIVVCLVSTITFNQQKTISRGS